MLYRTYKSSIYINKSFPNQIISLFFIKHKNEKLYFNQNFLNLIKISWYQSQIFHSHYIYYIIKFNEINPANK